jgi:hypothetical protein
MGDTKNDIAWKKLFKKYDISKRIATDGIYEIKSAEINEFREARLMTKFDYISQLPEIFADSNFSILPISRGSYVISDIDTFKDFETESPAITKVNFPNNIESIDYNNITSESAALNCVYVLGIIEDFVQEEELKPTVNGRMSSSVFDFKINSKRGIRNIKVINSQVEIDGGYEGNESLSLIEAKNSISADFLVRQIFYPYKLWRNKVTKEVRSLFLTYTNGIFHFREYEFTDPNHYNSLRLIREKIYTIREHGSTIKPIKEILSKVEIVSEPSIPFPQADSFERIINLCELLNENSSLSREYITINYDFNVRQTNYYTDAGRYLGLIDKKTENKEVMYFLTKTGKELFRTSIAERQLKFIEQILSHAVFNKVLKLYFENGDVPNNHKIVQIMKESNLYNIDSDTTFYRRASTISRWIVWITEQIED